MREAQTRNASCGEFSTLCFSDNVLMLVTRHHDVDHCEEHEDKRLHHADQTSERIKDNGYHELGKTRENPKHIVVREHVGKETDTERERTRQVIDDFDQQHKDY